MSAIARNATKGSHVSCYRPAKSAAGSGGGRTVTSWTALPAITRLELHSALAETVRKVWGEAVDVEVSVVVAPGADLAIGDGVVVTAGRHAGTRFRVSAERRQTKFTELALVSTEEAIP